MKVSSETRLVKNRAKEYRISKRKEILFIRENGNRWKSTHYLLVFLKNALSFDRAAVLVSKANGNAVRRNRIKRIYRELFYRNKRVDPPFFDILIVAVGKEDPPPEELQNSYLTWKTNLKNI